jgi:hypothetical protein
MNTMRETAVRVMPPGTETGWVKALRQGKEVAA